MEQRISFITLGVADLERSVAFYAALGWTHQPRKHENVVFYQAGGQILALHPRRMLAEDAHLPDEPVAPFGGITLAHNVRSEAEADAVFAQAIAAGGKPLKKPQKVFWGGYSGYFADPDGHPWEVAYNPFATIAEDGSIHL